jgi:hypothetical protein
MGADHRPRQPGKITVRDSAELGAISRTLSQT